MKRLFLTCVMAAAIPAGALAQGLIAIDNSSNSSHDRAALNNGLFWLGYELLNQDANLTLLAGASRDTLVPLKTFLISDGTAVGSSLFGPGTWTDVSGGTYAVPGVTAGGTGYFQVEIWLGNFSNYFSAVAAGGHAGQSLVFTQTLGGGTLLPEDLTHMPAVNLSLTLPPFPEPSTAALTGLGIAVLSLCRRRK